MYKPVSYWIGVVSIWGLYCLSNSAIADTTVYNFNFSVGGSGTFVYDDVTGEADPITLDFGSYGSANTNFGSSLTESVFGQPPLSAVKSDGVNIILQGGSHPRVLLNSDGTFCVARSDFVCELDGTYLMAPLGTFTGTYTFGFSDHGRGTLEYDEATQTMPQIQYDFGMWGSGSTDFGQALTANVFGIPPGETVVQDNTFFALNSDNLVSGEYHFNFSNYGMGGFTYNNDTQEASDFVMDFGVYGKFEELGTSSTITSMFGTPPDSFSSINGAYFPLKDAGGNQVSAMRFYSDGSFCLDLSGNNDCSFGDSGGTYAVARLSAHSLRLKSDGTFCVRPDAGFCNASNDLASGIYQIALLNPGETSPGTNVVAVPTITDESGEPIVDAPQVQLTFDSVDDSGDLTVTVIESTSGNAPELPSLFQLAGTSTYLDIDTTATFSGEVEVCIQYDPSGVDEANLELLHELSIGNWEVITSPGYPDTDLNLLCGTTSSFSFFAAAELVIQDSDDDGVADELDNCPATPNSSQADVDSDGGGDACDACPLDASNDIDGDGVCGDVDNCPSISNADQMDSDNDGLGDACNTAVDVDGDDWGDLLDNCPAISNSDQSDVDGDGSGDVCDVCPLDYANDIDGDGVCGDIDNCPSVENSNQSDKDTDGDGDACDTDDDGDLVPDADDNCPLTPNGDQSDFDYDGSGDVCDGDVDGDEITDADDQCLQTSPGEIVDGVGCSIPQLCPDTANWKNHGAYVKCVAQTAETFVEENLLTDAEKDAIVAEAAESDIGKKSK